MPSTFDIVPSLGHGIVTAQGQAGGYDAIDDRRFWGVGRQEGALAPSAYKVSQRSLGANMSVDIASELGSYLVQGDTVGEQGLYLVPSCPLKTNLDVTAAHVSNPRIDQVVLEARDSAHTLDGITRARLYILAGTATVGATLDNRTGAAALPASTTRLADVLVGTGVTTILTANIRDRRPWANGAFVRVLRNTADYTRGTSQPTFIAVDSTNLAIALECSGAPLIMTLTGTLNYLSGGAGANLKHMIDGVSPDSHVRTWQASGSFNHEWVTSPTAGWHTIAPYWNHSSGAGSAVLLANATDPLIFTIEEIIRTSATN